MRMRLVVTLGGLTASASNAPAGPASGRLPFRGLLRLRRDLPKVTRAKALPIYHGKGGLLKGIDASSNRALLDAADDT